MDKDKEMPGFMVYRDLLTGTKRLSDEELGRVFRGMMRYAFLGEMPEFDDDSREATAFDMVQPKMDHDYKKYSGQSNASKENGKKGGRPKKKKDPEPEPAKPEPEPVPVQPVKSSMIPFDDNVEDLMATQQDHDEIFKAADRAGVKLTQGAMDELIKLYVEYGKNQVIELLNQAAKNQIDKALPYVAKILREPNKPSWQDDDYATKMGGYL